MMKNSISINKYLLAGTIIAVMAISAYGGWYFTNSHYQTGEDKRLADKKQHNRDNVLCSTEVMRGKRGEVKSEYYIFERSAKQETCEKFVNYNVPEDTETVWMGF
jgi:hypothetical protein